MNLMRALVNELNHAKNEIISGVEGVKNLVSTHGQSLFSGRAAFNFNEAKFPCLWVLAFNIIAQFIELTVRRFKSKTTLHAHDNRAGARGDYLTINTIPCFSAAATGNF